MAKIVKGKTEGEHLATEKSQEPLRVSTTSPKGKRRRPLSKQAAKEVQEAMRDLENTKGDFSKDH